jgi:hypothetical protein
MRDKNGESRISMFDSKEIAHLALRRAAEIIAEKKRKRKLWITAGIYFGLFIMVLIIITMFFCE